MMGRCGRTESEELQSGQAARPRGTFTTATARTTPIEYTRADRLGHCLDALIRLPRRLHTSARAFLHRVPRLIPGPLKRSRGVKLCANHPAAVGLATAITIAVVAIAGEHVGEPHYQWEPERYQKWLARRGAHAVKASLAEIGPAVTIPSVNAKPAHELVAGYYTVASGDITFNSSVEHHPFFLLEIAAHECVHGIFIQNELTPADFLKDDYLVLVNEVAASVLGAHVVGRIISDDGRDGSIATEALFQYYRRNCDPQEPDGWYRDYLTPDRVHSGDFDRDDWHLALVHFGAPLELVDEVYEICYLNSDPVEAARKISRRFMTRDLAPRDRPILEEFERTRARWPGN